MKEITIKFDDDVSDGLIKKVEREIYKSITFEFGGTSLERGDNNIWHKIYLCTGCREQITKEQYDKYLGMCQMCYLDKSREQLISWIDCLNT